MVRTVADKGVGERFVLHELEVERGTIPNLVVHVVEAAGQGVRLLGQQELRRCI